MIFGFSNCKNKKILKKLDENVRFFIKPANVKKLKKIKVEAENKNTNQGYLFLNSCKDF